jgi:ABC-type Zn uptake system ZnuABC Zn-binding protein ZnuA
MAGLRRLALVLLAAALLPLAACGAGEPDAAGNQSSAGSPLRVVASLSFLADIAQNVAGDRFTVTALVPLDTDPHAFQPAPSDLRSVAAADLVLVNGGGLEESLTKSIVAAGGDAVIVEASKGLQSRRPQAGEPQLDEQGVDPHFWLDPMLVVTYVRNIRDAFSAADPQGAAAYEANAAAYIKQLEALDAEIKDKVATLPAERRKLVMNHASHGYYADAYGFEIIGTVIPGVTTGDTPTARQLSDLTRAIKETGARAIFVELGEDPRLARQIAAETGITVVDDLLDHSLTAPDGVAPTYLDMLRFTTERIVAALQ